jgi:sigma-E factor negative regulatory protein RseC
MTESEAIVTRVEGEFAFIEVKGGASACGSCGERSRCGKPQPGPRRYAVRNVVGAAPGDAVVVSVPEGAVLRAAAISYLMPLLLVLLGAAIGSNLIGDGLPAVGGAATGLVLGIVALRVLSSGDMFTREPKLAFKLKRSFIPIDKEA